MMKEFNKDDEARIQRAIRLANIKAIFKDLDIRYEDNNRQLKFLCPTPSHKDKEPSTFIGNQQGNPYYAIWHCFGCGASGNIIQLVRLNTGLSFWESVGYVEARISVEEQTEISKPTPCLPLEYVSPERLNEWKVEYLEYLYARKITDTQILKYNIGYCDTGRYAKRVIIPVTLDWKLCTWIGRAIRTDRLRITSCPSGTVGLFGSLYASPKHGPALLVEGWADALKLSRMGYMNVMALQTNRIHHIQYEYLHDYESIIVMPDADEGGIRLNNSLSEYVQEKSIYVAQLREGDDPDSASEEDIEYAMAHLSNWKPIIIKPDIEIIL